MTGFSKGKEFRMSEQFKRDNSRDLFIPKGFEPSEAEKQIQVAMYQAQQEIMKRTDAFLETSLRIILPNEVVDLIGKHPHQRNLAMMNLLGIQMTRKDRPDLGMFGSETALVKVARHKKDISFLVAALEICLVKDGEKSEIKFTSKVNRKAAEHRYRLTSPVIRQWLRSLKSVGVKEADDLLRIQFAKIVDVEVKEEGLSQEPEKPKPETSPEQPPGQQ